MSPMKTAMHAKSSTIVRAMGAVAAGSSQSTSKTQPSEAVTKTPVGER